jgi:hypothetical protein
MSLTQNIPFTTPNNYTYDSALIEVTGGVAKLKDLRPADASFYASFNTGINGTWANGVLTGTAAGGAAYTTSQKKFGAGSLDLAQNDLRYVTWAGLNNFSTAIQTGCIEFWLRPNYTTSPATTQYFYSSTGASRKNYIAIYHNTGGSLLILFYDSNSVVKLNANLGTWSPTAGTWYHFSLNFNVSTGVTELYLDGAKKGTTQSDIFTRSSDTTEIAIGTDESHTFTSNFYVDEVVLYDTVQRTGTFTPPAIEQTQTIYSTANPTIEVDSKWRIASLDEFVETVVEPGNDEVRYILLKNTSWYYLDPSSIWAVSNETYSQSEPGPNIETYKATFTSSIVIFGIRIFLHSDSGNTTPEINLLEISYDYSGPTPDTITRCIVSGYSKNPDGTVNTEVVSARLNRPVSKYGNYTGLSDTEITSTPTTEDGYWELELAETTNLVNGKYILNWMGKRYLIDSIPNEETKTVWELTLTEIN